MALNRGYVYQRRVALEEEGESVLAYHVARFEHSDSEAWVGSIAAGRVRLNGRVARADELLRRGDSLEYHRPAWNEPDVPLGFRVLLEDEHVLVVDKPAGLQVLPAGPFYEHTLARLVQASAPERAQCSPVHRLGRGTSGLILFGKTRAARAQLSHQFSVRMPRKTYLAVTQGCDLPRMRVARHPIGLLPNDPWSVHQVTSDGKPSETWLRVLRRDRPNNRCLTAARPITGRPNQIRIHCAAAGAPLVGDPLFIPGGAAREQVRSAEGGYRLHATGLTFMHPESLRWTKLRSSPEWLADLPATV